MTVIICALTMVAQAVYFVLQFNKQRQNIFDYLERKESEWLKERQQLMDRIQAGSFAEYKTQEVRVLKAQTPEKEKPMLEQL